MTLERTSPQLLGVTFPGLPSLPVAFPELRQSYGAKSVQKEEIHEDFVADSVDFPTIHGWNCGALVELRKQQQKRRSWMSF